MAENKPKDLINNIISKIPRPNYVEIPQLYEELDSMAQRIGEILVSSKLFDSDTLTIHFEKAGKKDIIELIKRDPNVMVPFFVMICGFSVRELERLYDIRDIYHLRSKLDMVKLNKFAEAIMDNLKYPLHLETVLYKFYKNWEEHQKRHYRGRRIEELVINMLRKREIPAGKIKIICHGDQREIDCAIPPDPDRLRVAIQIRTGVHRDLIKRAKEFSSEFDEILKCYPDVKFVVIYFTSPHEEERREEIYRKILDERRGKKPYDLVIVTSKLEEIEEQLVRKLEEWGER